jgi:hypothetical protein
MKLLTKAILNKLERNLITENEDDLPLKLFNACGQQTWLINRIDENQDIMYGLCDLGFGVVEWGAVSLNELLDVQKKMPYKVMIERDRYWSKGKVQDYIGKETLVGC